MNTIDVRQIELAVDEACSNVIIHSYQEDDSQNFTVTCGLNDNIFSVDVEDQGIIIKKRKKSHLILSSMVELRP